MLDKITFRSGVLLSSIFLNEVQKSPALDQTPRADFYALPTESEEDFWPIGQRDSLKDWELPNPSLEPQTAIGRLAYDGKIMGCINCNPDSTGEVQIVYGPPKITRKDIENGNSLGAGGAIIVNTGTVYDAQARSITWGVTYTPIEPSAVSYVYVTYEIDSLSGDITVEVLARPELPSNAQSYVPLARVELDANFDIVSFEDLRRGTLIDFLEKKDFVNSDIISETLDQPIQVWQRHLVDTTNGEVTLELPPAKDSDRISFIDISGTWGRNNLQVVTDLNSVDKIHGESLLTLDINDSYVSLVYIQALKEWRLENIDYSNSDRDSLGEFVSCGGSYCIGVTAPENCPNGQAIPPIFPEMSEGTYLYEPTSDSQGKCYKVIKDTWAIYSDGQGGYIQFPSERRCGAPRQELLTRDASTTIHVDAATGDDSKINNGELVPFRTVERALLQAARRDKKYTISLAPGEYYVDNAPGSSARIEGDAQSVYHNLVDTGHKVFNFDAETNILVLDEGLEAYGEIPPEAFRLGRTIFGASGSSATIREVKRLKVCTKDCGWVLYLANRQGSFATREHLFLNDLRVVNSTQGGIIVPNGTSLVAQDLRKTVIRPLYVPATDDDQTYIFKLTRDSYLAQLTFSDNLMVTSTHHQVISIGFASEQDLEENDVEITYYEKVKDLWLDDSLDSLAYYDELDIVAIVPQDISYKNTDTQENLTGAESPDNEYPRTDNFYRYPDKIRLGTTDTPMPVPDINSVRSSSPFVYNCSVRSIFGLNGALVDGNSVRGFKSMLFSNFTQVSIQIDPDAYVSGTYYAEPFAEEYPKQYLDTTRHFGFKVINNGYAQINSCFVIGNADHFVTESGGQMTVLNSTSNFGDTSITSHGYAPKPLPQDVGARLDSYLGTRITEIIPPVPLEGNMAEYKFSTGLGIDVSATKRYAETAENPNTLRLYVRAYNEKNILSEINPPSANMIAGENDFGYTTRITEIGINPYVLATDKAELNSFYIENSMGETDFLATFNNAAIDIDPLSVLDDRSRVFFWDDNPSRSINTLQDVSLYGNENTTGLYKNFGGNEQNAQNFFDDLGPEGSYLIIADKIYVLESKSKINSSNDGNNPNYKVNFYVTENLEEGIGGTSGLVDIETTLSNYLGGLWYAEVDAGADNTIISEILNNDTASNIYDLKEIYIKRNIDNRSEDEKLYKVLFEGFELTRGKRPPQEYFVLDTQVSSMYTDVDKYPLVVARVEPIEDFSGSYYVYLTKSNKVNTLIPEFIVDDPEVSPDSATEEAVNFLLSKIGTVPANIQLHTPSTIRATNHSWEWVGYLNYETSLPSLHLTYASYEKELEKILREINGGKGFVSGMTEAGIMIIPDVLKDISKVRKVPQAPVDPSKVKKLTVGTRLILASSAIASFKDYSRMSLSPRTRFVTEDEQTTISSEHSTYSAYASSNHAGLVQLSDSLLDENGDVIDNPSSVTAVTPSVLIDIVPELVPYANQAQTDAGTEEFIAVDPLRLNTFLDTKLSQRYATDTAPGLIEIASSAEFESGVNNRAVTPALIADSLTQIDNNTQSLTYLQTTGSSAINNVRLSHHSLDDAPSVSNTDENPLSQLFLHGSQISLWNGTYWEMKNIPSAKRSYFLSELDSDGQLTGNLIYYLYLFVDANNNNEVRLKAKSTTGAGVNPPAITDGIYCDPQDKKNRFVGLLKTASANNTYIQYTGSNKRLVNDTGDGAYIVNSNPQPSLGLVNIENKKEVPMNYIFSEPIPNSVVLPNQNTWITLENYCEVLSWDRAPIKGQMTIKNNAYTIKTLQLSIPYVDLPSNGETAVYDLPTSTPEVPTYLKSVIKNIPLNQPAGAYVLDANQNFAYQTGLTSARNTVAVCSLNVQAKEQSVTRVYYSFKTEIDPDVINTTVVLNDDATTNNYGMSLQVYC